MRSDAKASSAGSTQRQANSLGRIFRGALATRDGSPCVQGSGAPSAGSSILLSAQTRVLPLSIALLASLLAMVIAASSAMAVAPTIPVTTVSAVTTKAAVLEADVNPEGEATTYHFEYGLADCSSNPCTSVPVPDANVGSGSSAIRVTKEVTGLQPDTTYHFRVVATNTSGSTNGPDRTFTTYAPLPDSSACPNQAFRVGASARLPDCRGYEMVSPVDKDGGDIMTRCNINCHTTALNQSAVGGDKFTFSSYKAFAGAPNGDYTSQYLATRGADGWTTRGIGAPRGRTLFDPSYGAAGLDRLFKAFSSDLSSAWLTDINFEPLTPDGVPGIINLYRLDNGDGSFEALTNTANLGGAPGGIAVELHGISEDGSHAALGTGLALTPEASLDPNDLKLYDFHEGQLDLVSVLPDGTPFTGSAVAGSGSLGGNPERNWMRMHAVSADGSRIFWSANASSSFLEQKLYVRIDGETTVPVSEVPGSTYWTASRDGSKVVFSIGSTDGNELELYLFDVDAETTTPIADEVKGVLGASDDLSYVYYVSREALDAGATAGEYNLYLYRNGASNFITTLSPFDSAVTNITTPSAVRLDPILHNSRVTPDGRHIAFMSNRSLTGYDNTDAKSGEPDIEVFRYAADTEELTCVSCNPSGARPVGDFLRKPYAGNPNDEMFYNLETFWAAAWLNTQENALYAPRLLSEDGSRLFFNSYDALVPQDNNGEQDVYQWREQGVSGCQRTDGCVDLISSGESTTKSEFVDATPNGDNVFISTESSLVHQDPGLIDIYNVRVNGGYPPPPAPPTPCVGDACQNIPPPPNDPTPASASFRGAGDPVAKKPRRSCRAASRKAKASKQAKSKKAKRCKRANRGAGR